MIICLAVMFGYVLGRFLPKRWVVATVGTLKYWFLALLMAIGYHFGDHLLGPNNSWELVYQACLLAICIHLGVILMLSLVFPWRRFRTRPSDKDDALEKKSLTKKPLTKSPLAKKSVTISFAKTLQNTGGEIFKVLGTMALGVLFTLVLPKSYWPFVADHLVWVLMHILLFLVGMDLTLFRLRSQIRQLRLIHLWVPWLVMLGSWLGVLLGGFFMDLNWPTLLVFANGYGWFSLSGVMVEQHLGVHFGMLALLTDLVRELLGILWVVVFGKYHPICCVGITGTAAMDSALPLIRQATKPYAIPLALYSGVVLSLSVPLLLNLFIAGAAV